MNLIRIGIVLIIVGLILLIIPNLLLPKVYGAVGNTLSNITISLSTYSEFLIPIYVNNPAYLIISMNNSSHLLSIYLLDEFGHVLEPLGYKYERGLYLVIFPLVKHGNYTLVVFNGYPEKLNASLSIAMVYQYIVGNAVLMNLVMVLGVVIFIFGVAIITVKTLHRALNGLKI